MIRIPGLDLIGWALLNSFWQFALLCGLYLLITGTRKRFTAALRHNIALALSLAGSLWFIRGLSASPAEALPGPLRSLHATPHTGPFVLSSLRTQLFYYLDDFAGFVPYLYVSLLLIRCGGLLQQWFRDRPATRCQVSPTGGASEAYWTALFDRCLREMNIRRPVRLRWTSGRGMALTSGFFRPVVCFPFALLNHMPPAEIEAILIHELAHVRRADYLGHLWISFFGFLFFFNPFARFLCEAVSLERELACDDLVLGRNCPPRTYAHALLSLERFRQFETRAFLASGGYGSMQLSDRIRRICGLPVAPRPVRPLLLRSVGFIIVLLTLCTGRPGMSSLTPESAPRDPSVPVIAARSTVAPAAFGPLASHPSPSLKVTTPVLPKPLPATIRTREPLPAAGGQRIPERPDTGLTASAFSMPELGSGDVPSAIETDENDFATGKTTRNFSYRLAGPPSVSPAIASGASPYVPSSSFDYPEPDTVPLIALQSLEENKPAVLQLLARWKMLQWQQHLSRDLESRYQSLRQQEQKMASKTLPARKQELKKAMEELKIRMRKRKAEIDRLSALLAEGPVINI